MTRKSIAAEIVSYRDGTSTAFLLPWGTFEAPAHISPTFAADTRSGERFERVSGVTVVRANTPARLLKKLAKFNPTTTVQL